uniref:Uncharacterized protein n=1 Tax=Timema poppense TaxID=170557 RepID=A0A7R9D811_TIMPO|nr:unnamed protein product [Timema poppensis]
MITSSGKPRLPGSMTSRFQGHDLFLATKLAPGMSHQGKPITGERDARAELDTTSKSEVVLKEEINNFEQLEYEQDSILIPPIRENLDVHLQLVDSDDSSSNVDAMAATPTPRTP